ncbi:MAG: hypothetical protein LBH43_02085, partial [Treponema sp.]|nr:hypothetical protein [Treponema sp.]
PIAPLKGLKKTTRAALWGKETAHGKDASRSRAAAPFARPVPKAGLTISNCMKTALAAPSRMV